MLEAVGPLFTFEMNVRPFELELFTIGQIVDHLEYLTRGAKSGDQEGAHS